MAIPTVRCSHAERQSCDAWLRRWALYLPLYDYLMGHMGSLGWYAPLVAGATSRTAAVLCTSPLELLRTRAQVSSV